MFRKKYCRKQLLKDAGTKIILGTDGGCNRVHFYLCVCHFVYDVSCIIIIIVSHVIHFVSDIVVFDS